MKSLNFFSLLFCFFVSQLSAQTSSQILTDIVQRFRKVESYQASVHMKFDISFVRIEDIDGNVFFRQPDRFRVKTEGIAFLPKQNPAYAMQAISDSSKYSAVESAKEFIGNVQVRVINVIPMSHPELVLAKFWIDPLKKLILKSQLTTKSNGTIQVEYKYGKWTDYTLPDEMTFTIETGKFKMPKAMSVDINSKKKTEASDKVKDTGTIQLKFSNYVLNQKIDDKIFTE